MPRGIPNPKPAPALEQDDDAELARMIAEEAAEQTKAAIAAAVEAARAEAFAEGVAAAKAELEPVADSRPAEEIAVAMEVLRGQAEALRLDVDPAWSPEELAERVLQAQEAARAADKQAFAKADKVWVFLLRDGFPVEDEKRFAGETIQVTPEIAEKWYVAGVARPGTAPAA